MTEWRSQRMTCLYAVDFGVFNLLGQPFPHVVVLSDGAAVLVKQIVTLSLQISYLCGEFLK